MLQRSGKDATSRLAYGRPMIRIIGGLLIIWLLLSVLGFILKGLLWLAVIGLVLFVITALVGFIRRNTAGRP